MNKKNIKDIYELTPMQSGMLYHAIQDSKANLHIVQGCVKLKGVMHAELLEQSFNHIIQKYDVLRTAFVYEKVNQPLQIIFKDRPAKLELVDLSYLEEKQKALVQYRTSDRNRAFDLTKDVLIRLHLVKLGHENYELIWNFHHMLMDGWCWSIVFDELITVYGQLLKGETPYIEQEIPYSQYVQWLQQQHYDRGRQFWQESLQGFEDATTIPNQKNPADQFTYREYQWQLDAELTSQLSTLAKTYQTTVNNVFQTVWGILLQKVNTVNDAVFGAVVSGRSPEIPHVEKIVGLFINTVPVRIHTQVGDTFATLLQRNHEWAIQAKQQEHVSLADIQADSACGDKLIDHIVVFENYQSTSDSVQEKFNQLGLSFARGESYEPSSYGLTIVVEPSDRLHVTFAFNEEQYTSEFIQNISQYMGNIFNCVIDNPQLEIQQIQWLTKEEEQHILSDDDQLYVDYPKHKTVHQLFEDQVQRTPDRIAVTYENKQYTYAQLNEKANQLARILQKNDVQKETIVAICIDRSLDMMVSMLAILKANGTYLPIDPHYPEERIQYMLADSQAQVLIVEHASMVSPKYEGTTIVLAEQHLKQEDHSNLQLQVDPNDVAYVIYTSGSTGKPKGVMVEHRNVVRLLFHEQNLFDFNEHDTWTMFHSMCFDFSVWEIYGALLYGGRLVIVSLQVAQDTKQFYDVVRDQQVTILNQTPAAFYLFIEQAMLEQGQPLSLRKVIFGGEALSPIKLKDWKRKYNDTMLINMYGITETTVHVTYKEVTDEDIQLNVSNIGRTIPTLKTYVLDPDQRILPDGVPGELCVSGEGVARGYLHRSELTKERFIDNPFISGYKLYRSGDLVKRLPNGEMEYLGRMDHQVKIRGHRIELGEVTSKLLQLDDVKDGIVIAKQDQQGIYYLCAYYVEEKPTSPSTIRDDMVSSLPQYMIPSYFIKLQSLPITFNGKIKRDALPDPQEKRQASAAYEEPRNEVELKLVNIYQQVLEVQKIGIQDHFLELGGHSLKATMIVSKLQKAFDMDVPVNEIFLRPTIKQLAQFMQHSQGRTYADIAPAQEKDYYPATAQQKAIFAIEKLDEQGVSYNIPFAIEIEGVVEHEHVEHCLQQLVARHEALRTSFHFVDGQLMQKVEEDIIVKLPACLVKAEAVDKQIEDFIQPFSLHKAPLFRAKYVNIQEGRHLLLLDAHHIIVDGMSMNILTQEFIQLYEQRVLPVLPLQYKDYAVWQQEWFMSDDFNKKGEFWRREFADKVEPLDLQTDYPRPRVQTFKGEHIRFELDAQMTQQLRQHATDRGVTLYMWMLAAYNILLCKYSGQQQIVVGSPVSGRHMASLEPIVGMFANVLPIKNEVKPEQSIEEFVTALKKVCMLVYQHGDYPLEELLSQLNIRRDVSKNPLFDTLFILQDIEDFTSNVSSRQFKGYELEAGSAKFDMTWEIQSGETLGFDVVYNEGLFKRDTIERMIEHYKMLLQQMINQPQATIKELELVTTSEKEQLLHNFNQTALHDSTHQTIMYCFEQQVKQTPHHIAVEYRNEQLTYAELKRKIDTVAALLLQKEVKRSDVIGVMLSPSVETIVAIFAVLKAGAAYLPIDPTYPKERIQYFLEDSGASLLFVDDMKMKPEQYQGTMITKSMLNHLAPSLTAVEKDMDPDDLAYIIYTSGSTGKPKGVMVKHHSVVNLSLIADTLHIRENSRVLQFSSFSFDASVWNMFPTLLTGATLLIEDRETILEEGVAQWIHRKDVSVATLPPSVVRTMETMELPALRTLVTAGEPCSLDIVQRFSKGRMFFNAYGPTETTVCATIAACDVHTEHITIGKPIQNTKVYIVNTDHQLQPIGVPGELCVSGEGLALGYYNRPLLTKEKFIPNPFEPGKLMYKTGDVARWLQNGEIEYLGRIDNQVKIRGHRVEVGEITNTLLKHDQLQEVFIAQHAAAENEISLCAYYVPKKRIAGSDLRIWLGQYVPDYMVPTFFVEVSALPLTVNGKIDHHQLPKPSLDQHGYHPPTTEKEKVIASVWEEVLEVSKVGMQHHFFEMGGDSIKAIQIIAKLKKHGWTFKLKHLFTYPTIAELTPFVYRDDAVMNDSVVEGEVPLAPIQKWVFELTGTPNHWNQAVMLKHKQGWDVAAIQGSFNKILAHHDALRMKYEMKNMQQVQINQGVAGEHFTLDVYDYTKETKVEQRIEHTANELQRSFNITEGRLVKLALFHTNDGDHLLLIVHHLVIDTVSWRVIMEDFEYAYDQLLQGEEIKFPAKTTSYQQWGKEMTSLANTPSFVQQALAYWQPILQIETPRLPADAEAVAREATFGEMKPLSVEFTKEQTNVLLMKANKVFGTETNELLFSAFVLSMQQWTGKDCVVFDVEGHGREQMLDGVDVSRTVGWFTSVYPVVIQEQSRELSAVISTVKRTFRNIPNKGMSYSMLKYLTEKQHKHALYINLRPNVMFNYLGQFKNGFEQHTVCSSNIPMGDMVHLDFPWPYDLDVSASIMEGKLNMTFRFNSHRFSLATMQQLLQRYKTALNMIQATCQEDYIIS
ncbi:non-ribosomal peptide synthetase [Longirhabdus pacifica]|uniref:non-ribosomal peptide synthetase n=1 Tax=Longirhabdus pacifica TaxID=2305227 RepID=UPI0013E8C528|nr:non-ribosomal peptide synthetase [Longirhabdus pacifica]